MRIYCSGPLFSPEEVGGMQAIANALEAAGHTTFLPHRDGLEPYVLHLGGTPLPPGLGAIRNHIDYAIFALDVYELTERCDAVVCNLNGRVPDEGMIVEAALAFAAGKPLVLYKDDARAPFGGYDNSMLTGLVRGNIVRGLKDLPLAIQRAMNRKPSPVSLAADMMEAVAHGKRISTLLARAPAGVGKKRWEREVVFQVIHEVAKQED